MKKNKILASILAVVTATSLAACGGGGSSYKASEPAMATAAEESYYNSSDDVYDYSYEEADIEESMAIDNGGNESEPEVVKPNNARKIIKTVSLTTETKEFDKFVSTVTNKVDALGGYLESTDITGRSINNSSDYLRRANITARIPSEKLNDFVNHVTDNSNITNKSESAEDVTLSYADTEARIASLRVEQERLNELMKEAEDIDTIIALENRITEVRYEIESHESRLRTMDNKVDYSTVYINVSEVREITPVVTKELTFGERVSQGFAESCRDVAKGFVNFIAGLIISLPYIFVLLLFLAIFALIIFLVIRFIIKLVKKFDEKNARNNAAAKQQRGQTLSQRGTHEVGEMAATTKTTTGTDTNSQNNNGDRH